MPGASDVTFNSLPIMCKNGEPVNHEDGYLQSQHIFAADGTGRVLSNSYPEAVICQPSVDSNFNGRLLLNSSPEPIVCQEPTVHENKDSPSCQLVNSFEQRKYFAPHWPAESISESLEKGDIFRALFHVNAHNRLEAYCKIDGLQTDVFISGTVAQNRAVEGDIVAIKVDPPSLWTKMKGFSVVVDNVTAVDDGSSHLDAGKIILDSIKGEKKVDEECNCHHESNKLTAKNGFPPKNGYCHGEVVCQEMIGPSDKCYVNGSYTDVSDQSRLGCSSGRNEAAKAVENLCAMLSEFPSKRPTGRVVGIIEKSHRRDTIVGFLGVKQLIQGREGNRKDSKKNKHALNHNFVMLTPTDPRFSKLMVPLRSLPDSIKNRLEVGDATVEMDLVAARIIDWREENNVPEAHVMCCFGRGGEIEAQIAAILFENSIDASEFSPETLSCLPHIPWEIPQEEFECRRDLRNLCVFSIDPATATDLDDALSFDRLSNGVFRVGVHIADVSFFVLPDTALDIDAQIRSTGVYMLQHKLPMLPPVLSDNLCSLNPGKDRLAFSMFWDIDPTGQVLDRWIGRTIIHSTCQLSYEHAQKIIDGVSDAQSSSTAVNDWPDLHGRFEWSDIIRSVKGLHEISRILKERRFNDGALSLETPKVVFLFNEDGVPYESVLSGQKESNFLVEEFMLLANRTAAEVITRAYPSRALLRKHPEPNLRKLREFDTFCSKNGLKLDISSSGQLHRSLEHIRRELKNDSVMLDILMSYASRPMQLAAYFCSGDTSNAETDRGHYALAVPLYTHFTSPLRRYPDIVVHRTLAATLEAEKIYVKHKESLQIDNEKEFMSFKCFTSGCYVKDTVESPEAQQALVIAASKYRVPCSETIADVAAHCNERKLASRHVKDATDKLYMWALLKKKEILCLEARVLGLGPRFMSIYIHKLAIERRIYYDDVEGLTAEWLDATSTLVISQSIKKRCNKRGSPGKFRALEDVALLISPCDSKLGLNLSGESCTNEHNGNCQKEPDSYSCDTSQVTDVEPAVFPLTVCFLSTIPVALHAVGGDNGPVDIGARLYVSSYFSFK